MKRNFILATGQYFAVDDNMYWIGQIRFHPNKPYLCTIESVYHDRALTSHKKDNQGSNDKADDGHQEDLCPGWVALLPTGAIDAGRILLIG